MKQKQKLEITWSLQKHFECVIDVKKKKIVLFKLSETISK